MDAAELIQTTFEIFKGSAQVPVAVPRPDLGMAYAIPSGTEESAVEDYAPWYSTDVKQVFYRESILGSPLAEIQMVMRWRYSASGQYIINAYFDTNVIELDPTTDVSIKVTFDSPSPYDVGWESYEIPFHVAVHFDPVGGSQNPLFDGVIRGDGTGVFNPEQ